VIYMVEMALLDLAQRVEWDARSSPTSTGSSRSRQWRIVFRWEDNGASEVEFTDYH